MSDYPMFDEFGARLNDGGDDAPCFDKAFAPDPPEPDPYGDELAELKTIYAAAIKEFDNLDANLNRLLKENTELTEERDGLAASINLAIAEISKLPRQGGNRITESFGKPWIEAALCELNSAMAKSSAILARVKAEARAEGLADYLTEAREFSRRTFGEGNRTLGVTKHIEKEIAEVRAKPFDLTEWVDIIILACDGYWRHGGRPENLLADMMAKLEKNKARTWPKPTSEDEAVEHDRTYDDPLNPELGPEHREYWIRKAGGM